MKKKEGSRKRKENERGWEGNGDWNLLVFERLGSMIGTASTTNKAHINLHTV